MLATSQRKHTDGHATSPLAGQNVLIVEDEIFIALDLKFTIDREGARVTLAHSLAEGFAALEEHSTGFDLAVLDVHLGEEEVFPLAEALQEAGCTLIFHTGGGDPDEILNQFPHALVIPKPSRSQRLVDMLGGTKEAG